MTMNGNEMAWDESLSIPHATPRAEELKSFWASPETIRAKEPKSPLPDARIIPLAERPGGEDTATATQSKSECFTCFVS